MGCIAQVDVSDEQIVPFADAESELDDPASNQNSNGGSTNDNLNSDPGSNDNVNANQGPVCGDGIVDPLELCDDGAQNSDAWGPTRRCNTRCDGYAPYCGDAALQGAFEVCDDGTVNGDDWTRTARCNSECSGLAPHCGDGVLEANEEVCDEGDGNSSTWSALARCNVECTGTSPYCGDGELDAGFEACDDGDTDDNNGCRNNCTLASCGDGVVNNGEQCDSGGINSTTCDANCTLVECGDGFVNDAAGEVCDGSGVATAQCDIDCTVPECGDRVVNDAAGEDCDDGGVASASCDADCSAVVCGDGVANSAAGEACDDGGIFTAACDADCTTPECGDSVTNAPAGEACDEGGVASASCDADCTAVECGDNVRNAAAGEACDNGGVASASCDADCTAVECGDGTINGAAGETCEEGGVATASCDADCTAVECGDGVVNAAAGEGCDDGDGNLLDSCPDGTIGTCQPATCGDGFTWNIDGGAEQCDGSGVNTVDCNADCTTATCGDGKLNAVAGEQCDDGDGDNSDSCPDGPGGSCVAASCGDRFVWNTDGGSEACDDGANGNAGDGCDDSCMITGPVCGDGEVNGSEVCDDGNTVNELPHPSTDPDADYAASACTRDCSFDPSLCHDGNLDPGEDCDLGVDPADSMGDCTRSCQTNDYSFGAACVTDAGPDEPNYAAGTITGCDNIPTDFDADCELGCINSINSPSGAVYWPGGYCSLFAMECTGLSFICDSVAKVGNPDLCSCPDGLVRVEQETSVISLATIKTVVCAAPCTTDADCRVREYDERWSEWGQYRCTPTSTGQSICFDPRNQIFLPP
ncbi:MAG: hypothetical protein AAFQ82_12300 [Myxococcota bacterium]